MRPGKSPNTANGASTRGFTRKASLVAALAALLLQGCASSDWITRNEGIKAIVSAAGWQEELIATSHFSLRAYVPRQITSSRTLAVYIEGDGLAWRSPTLPSDNPTPRRAIGLELALRHPATAVAYLGRPCQGVGESDWGKCEQRYWTNARFSPEVVAASDEAISRLKQRFNAEKLVLVGYSGGGSVAALLAATRDDVAQLITVAGNLDTEAWTRHHRVSPLTGSLNPSAYVAKLAPLRQNHYVGAKDRVIPAWLVEDFAAKIPAARRPVVTVIADFDHQCCWADAWPRLIKSALPEELSR